MYEYDVVEMNDSNFNHLVHHFDEEVCEMIEYAQELDALGFHAEYGSGIYWDEH
ncbi:MAG: hypothetical protein PHP90_09425 [Sulfuricurvum sp.]|jgi:hypothetical protein|uniref:hypothetical protein n=1 Tax=Sulfuricurvum sp. TaxID=2025608 RepID=UPI0026106588|nr:hypothetical protein [Sulfuricurvum sp.]MDD5118797.1 hypothetical protein [Sulfuricurvum sp.]